MKFHSMRLIMRSGLLCLAACTAASSHAATDSDGIEALYTVQADGQRASLRVVTTQATCPSVSWAHHKPQRMAVRATPATVPVRAGAAQKDSKAAAFEVLTCEAAWPLGVTLARVGQRTAPAPAADISRIVIIADTGCRMKASDNACQDCNDPQKWPFARIAQSAAAMRPDLVIHIGDIHYRESPCPDGNAGCANSPWGYGYDTWKADLFKPAKPLLAAAPWVFVRGNHESCFRAGQGWFRFVDAQPWTPARSCNDPAQDAQADFSRPYAVAITPHAQFIVFDSSKASGKPYDPQDAAFRQYSADWQAVAQLAQATDHSYFISHHPLLAIAPGSHPKPGGTAGLQSAFASQNPQRLFPEKIEVALHGHVHLFESLSFEGAHPASLVMGNAGSANEGKVVQNLPVGYEAYPGAVVQDYAARADYGFATLDRLNPTGSAWRLTEHNVDGKPVLRCTVQNGKSRCAELL